MDAVKATALLKKVLFSMAFAIGAGFALMLIYARLDALQGSPPGESVNVFHLPAPTLALLVGIPAVPFFLACAAGLWERRLRKKKRAREKKSMREALGRIPTEGAFRDDFGDGFGDGPRDSSGR